MCVQIGAFQERAQVNEAEGQLLKNIGVNVIELRAGQLLGADSPARRHREQAENIGTICARRIERRPFLLDWTSVAVPGKSARPIGGG